MADKAVIVGGTRRVGRWCSEALLAAGWSVLALYRSGADEAAAFHAELEAAGLPLGIAQADAASEGALKQPLEDYCGADPLRLLVYSAGPASRGPLSALDSAGLEDLWRANVLGFHNAVRSSLQHMQRGSAIIGFISAGNETLRAYREVAAYGACKTMLASYCRSLARELAPRGIAVNCIALGVTDLPPEGVPAISADAIPAGELVGQEDLARALWQLSRADSAVLTGSVINLGGAFGL
ncbi:SDR family oxidoreductase [bacterium]|nr:SDR family oxidoreductase [bacterium]